MKNKVETFDSFNNGMKRPDRKRHMELCGFRLCGSALIPADAGFKKPKIGLNGGNMLYEVAPLSIVYSKSGIRFKVLCLARHGQDCSIPMVVYTNLEKTVDAEVGTVWVIEESIFMQRFFDQQGR